MQSMQFKVDIAAPREKVWKTILEPDTYTAWTTAFMPGSYYEGNWSEGSKMLFLGPTEAGKTEGMVARIKTNRPNQHVVIEHQGVVHDGVEDTTSEEAKRWAGALEAYTLRDKDGGTEVVVDLQSAEVDKDMLDMFKDMWPRALQDLKRLAES